MTHDPVSSRIADTALRRTSAADYFTRHVGIPMQILLDTPLTGNRRPIELIAQFAATYNGYSVKLKFLENTQEATIGTLDELLGAGTRHQGPVSCYLRARYELDEFHPKDHSMMAVRLFDDDETGEFSSGTDLREMFDEVSRDVKGWRATLATLFFARGEWKYHSVSHVVAGASDGAVSLHTMSGQGGGTSSACVRRPPPQPLIDRLEAGGRDDDDQVPL